MATKKMRHKKSTKRSSKKLANKKLGAVRTTIISPRDLATGLG